MPLTRRTFLRRSACAALGAAAADSLLGDLVGIAAAAPRATAASDYKALVCVFLDGGNDGNNTVIPYGPTEYAGYAAGRGVLARPRASLLPLSASSDGRAWSFAPELAPLHPLYGQGRLAVLGNVGPLVAPATRADYENGTSAIPPDLFSHFDQAVHWQTSLPDRPRETGWGGRVADALASLSPSARISTAISFAGSNIYEVGRNVSPYQMSTEGTFGLDGYDPAGGDARSRAIRALLGLSRGQLLEDAFRGVTRRAIDADVLVRAALAGVPALTTVFPDNDLGRQLGMVAKMIGARTGLAQNRQVFFCDTGGFDTHGSQLAYHPGLLADVALALRAFHDATVEMGVASGVTTFTASEFGRTWPTNGGGSDHGWGSHHLILGGAVAGGRIYGRMPILVENGPDDSDRGSWIPSTSVDEYGATLARWFGVSPADLSAVFPNLGRFANPNVGFMG